MTIASMTGFGRGESSDGVRVWNVEVRSVNNRFLDLKIKLPRGYIPLEEGIRAKVAAVCQRGRVDVGLTVSGDFSSQQEVKVNLALAAAYRRGLEQLEEGLELPPIPVAASLLASYPEVFIREQRDDDLEKVWPHVAAAVDEALANFDVMRRQEGEALARDLIARVEAFAGTIDGIAATIPQLVDGRRIALNERLDKLLGGVQLDPQRLAQEVAILADKTDVTEEVVRLRCHIKQFTLFLGQPGGVGRKLDFLLQEFLREVNTLASKINDASIAHLTVDLKSELEKMREQVQNIE